jgi:hypothetical protein
MFAVAIVEEACVVVAKVEVPTTKSVPDSERFGTVRLVAKRFEMFAVPIVDEAIVVVASVEVPLKVERPVSEKEPTMDEANCARLA